MFNLQRPALLPDVIEEVSGEVYHYTSPEGLLGILGGDCLWASEATSLNDLTEVRYGWQIVDSWIRDQSPSEAVDVIQDAASRFGGRDKDAFTHRDVFVLSASRDRDDANQWRLYGADRKGYALGLDASVPLAAVSRKNFEPENRLGVGFYIRHIVRVSPWLGVLYGVDPVNAALEELLDSADAAFEDVANTDFGADPDEPSKAVQDLKDDIRTAAATIAALAKPSGFRGENEVRIVVTCAFGATHYRYRASEHGIVPYVTLAARPSDLREPRVIEPAEKEVESLPIKSVTLGPGLREENARATNGVLIRHGHTGVQVSRSHVPLR